MSDSFQPSSLSNEPGVTLNEECDSLWSGYLTSEAIGQYGNTTFPRPKVRSIFRGDPDVQNIQVNQREVDFVLCKAVETLIFDLTLQARTLAEEEWLAAGGVYGPKKEPKLTKEHMARVIELNPHLSPFAFILRAERLENLINTNEIEPILITPNPNGGTSNPGHHGNTLNGFEQNVTPVLSNKSSMMIDNNTSSTHSYTDTTSIAADITGNVPVVAPKKQPKPKAEKVAKNEKTTRVAAAATATATTTTPTPTRTNPTRQSARLQRGQYASQWQSPVDSVNDTIIVDTGFEMQNEHKLQNNNEVLYDVSERSSFTIGSTKQLSPVDEIGTQGNLQQVGGRNHGTNTNNSDNNNYNNNNYNQPLDDCLNVPNHGVLLHYRPQSGDIMIPNNNSDSSNNNNINTQQSTQFSSNTTNNTPHQSQFNRNQVPVYNNTIGQGSNNNNNNNPHTFSPTIPATTQNQYPSSHVLLPSGLLQQPSHQNLSAPSTQQQQQQQQHNNNNNNNNMMQQSQYQQYPNSSSSSLHTGISHQQGQGYGPTIIPTLQQRILNQSPQPPLFTPTMLIPHSSQQSQQQQQQQQQLQVNGTIVNINNVVGVGNGNANSNNNNNKGTNANSGLLFPSVLKTNPSHQPPLGMVVGAAGNATNNTNNNNNNDHDTRQRPQSGNNQSNLTNLQAAAIPNIQSNNLANLQPTSPQMGHDGTISTQQSLQNLTESSNNMIPNGSSNNGNNVHFNVTGSTSSSQNNNSNNGILSITALTQKPSHTQHITGYPPNTNNNIANNTALLQQQPLTGSSSYQTLVGTNEKNNNMNNNNSIIFPSTQPASNNGTHQTSRNISPIGPSDDNTNENDENNKNIDNNNQKNEIKNNELVPGSLQHQTSIVIQQPTPLLRKNDHVNAQSNSLMSSNNSKNNYKSTLLPQQSVFNRNKMNSTTNMGNVNGMGMNNMTHIGINTIGMGTISPVVGVGMPTSHHNSHLIASTTTATGSILVTPPVNPTNRGNNNNFNNNNNNFNNNNFNNSNNNFNNNNNNFNNPIPSVMISNFQTNTNTNTPTIMISNYQTTTNNNTPNAALAMPTSINPHITNNVLGNNMLINTGLMKFDTGIDHTSINQQLVSINNNNNNNNNNINNNNAVYLSPNGMSVLPQGIPGMTQAMPVPQQQIPTQPQKRSFFATQQSNILSSMVFVSDKNKNNNNLSNNNSHNRTNNHLHNVLSNTNNNNNNNNVNDLANIPSMTYTGPHATFSASTGSSSHHSIAPLVHNNNNNNNSNNNNNNSNNNFATLTPSILSPHASGTNMPIPVNQQFFSNGQ